MTAISCLAYVRQSVGRTAANESLSLIGQEAALRTFASERDWTVSQVIQDHDEKGWNDKRPGLLELMSLCETGKYRVVVVYDLSRLARSVRIQEDIVYRLSKLNVRVVSRSEIWTDDPLMRQILGAIAEHTTRTIQRYAIATTEQRVLRGQLVGRAPIGYSKSDRLLHIVPDDAALVRSIFERYRDGWGSSAIADHLTAQAILSPAGTTRWRPDVILRILRNPTYIGIQRIRGDDHPGAWEPIIDRDVWDQVQSLSASGRHPKTSHEGRSWLQGIALHACGSKLYFHGGNHTTKPDGSRTVWHYYCCANAYNPAAKCTVRPVAIARIKFERAIAAQFHNDITGVIDPTLAHQEATRRIDAPNATTHLRTLTARRQDAQDERERAYQAFKAGRRPEALWHVEDDALAAELATIDADIAAVTIAPPIDVYRIAADAIAAVAATISDGLPPDQIRRILVGWGARAVLMPDGPALKYPGVLADLLGRG